MRETIEEILSLQEAYTTENTVEMQQRGELVRKELRAWVESVALPAAEGEFAEGVDDVRVDASDGVGLKAAVPWVRLASKTLAPTARQGWYLVYLFAADGSRAYLVLGQATTEIGLPSLLESGNEWARSLVEVPDGLDVVTEIALVAPENASGASYEDGAAYAIEYPAPQVPADSELEADLLAMRGLLAQLYNAIAKGAHMPTEDPKWWTSELHARLQAVGDLSAPSTTKFAPVDELVAAAAKRKSGEVYTVGVSKPGNFSVRTTQSKRALSASVIVVVAFDEADAASLSDLAVAAVEKGRPPAMVLIDRDADDEHWRVASVVARTGSEVALRLGRLYPDADMQSVGTALDTEASAVVLDARTERMLRAAYRSSRFVVLVGPPGTGKSRLAADLLVQAASEPIPHGVSAPPRAMWVTPDENWSARHLVGGETVDADGSIVFWPGYLLQALADNCQLVIDELNRADMDRIFGPALTFLAGQEVVVGRESQAPDAPAVVLRWLDQPSSKCFYDEDGTLVYGAGMDFRILGTYNGVDAHQVFRLGQALGRRFRQIPIGPADLAKFTELLDDRVSGLAVPDDLRANVRAIVPAIYDTHLNLFADLVSPASFLDMPAHIAASEDGPFEEVLGEAYVANIGGWLARLEPEEIDRLGRALVEDDVLTEDGWMWIRRHVSLLA